MPDGSRVDCSLGVTRCERWTSEDELAWQERAYSFSGPGREGREQNGTERQGKPAG